MRFIANVWVFWLWNVTLPFRHFPAICGCFCGAIAFAANIGAVKCSDTTDLSESMAGMTIPQLIDCLTESSSEDDAAMLAPVFDVASRLSRTDHKRGQLSDDEKARCSTGGMAACELVRRGLVAVPFLLNHIEDRRLTQARVAPLGSVSGFSRKNWYKPRFAFDRNKEPPGISAIEAESTSTPDWGREYVLTVGDVCYFVIGQIVNRDLRVLHSRLTQSIVITSPTATPVLAAAVRTDWAGITANEHCRSLVRDSWQSDTPGDAVSLLLMYYPDEGVHEALKLLKRPVYYKSPAQDLVCNVLLKIDDLDECRELIEKCREDFGNAIDADIQWELYALAGRRPARHESEASLVQSRRASRTLARFYVTFKPESAAPPTSTTYRIQESVISGLCGCRPSEQLDAAVFRVFTETNAAAPAGDLIRQDFDLLSIACIRRLAGGRYDAALRDFIDKRIAALERRSPAFTKGTCLAEFRKWQGCLQDMKR